MHCATRVLNGLVLDIWTLFNWSFILYKCKFSTIKTMFNIVVIHILFRVHFKIDWKMKLKNGGRTGGVGHQPELPDVQKRFFLAAFVCFWVRIGVRHPLHPPVQGVRITIYFSFWTLLRAIRSGCLYTGGEAVSSKRTTSDRGGGPKSIFLLGRLWWMTPYCGHKICTFSNITTSQHG